MDQMPNTLHRFGYFIDNWANILDNKITYKIALFYRDIFKIFTMINSLKHGIMLILWTLKIEILKINS